jgi:hypothetical protein
MKSLKERPLLLAGIVFAVVIGAVLLWIALGETGIHSDQYNP